VRQPRLLTALGHACRRQVKTDPGAPCRPGVRLRLPLTMPPQEVIASYPGSCSRDVDDDARTDVRALCPPARCQARTRAGLAGDGGKSTWRLPGSRERLSPTRRNWRAGPTRLRVRDSGRPRRRPAGGRRRDVVVEAAVLVVNDYEHRLLQSRRQGCRWLRPLMSADHRSPGAVPGREPAP
jgi:hypothetical protein